MRIISHRAIVQFVLSHPNAKSGLDHWYRTIKAGTFQKLAELRAVWPATDPAKRHDGITVFVFNISGNEYRLIAKIEFTFQHVYILEILTHAEYDQEKWK